MPLAKLTVTIVLDKVHLVLVGRKPRVYNLEPPCHHKENSGEDDVNHKETSANMSKQ